MENVARLQRARPPGILGHAEDRRPRADDAVGGAVVHQWHCKRD